MKRRLFVLEALMCLFGFLAYGQSYGSTSAATTLTDPYWNGTSATLSMVTITTGSTISSNDTLTLSRQSNDGCEYPFSNHDGRCETRISFSTLGVMCKVGQYATTSGTEIVCSYPTLQLQYDEITEEVR